MDALADAERGVVLLGYQIRSPEAHQAFWDAVPAAFPVIEKVSREHLDPEYAFEESDVFILRRRPRQYTAVVSMMFKGNKLWWNGNCMISAVVHYWKKASRKEEIKMVLSGNNRSALDYWREVLVQAEQMRKELKLSEKGDGICEGDIGNMGNSLIYVSRAVTKQNRSTQVFL
ncbi:unnamed protein product [Triticum turgidum subsp. durum]|uniref:Uncharacterized protein n=1 Tax=Triticum turgidum subsp. durum TaxID=4567 RepID=A0A9R0QFH1_TRITD|nr:unnamed protein product [Triticum turgidum subsp. durum]